MKAADGRRASAKSADMKSGTKKRPLGTARGKIVLRRPLKAPLPAYLRKAFGIE